VDSSQKIYFCLISNDPENIPFYFFAGEIATPWTGGKTKLFAIPSG
jgi:hypothetical protein